MEGPTEQQEGGRPGALVIGLASAGVLALVVFTLMVADAGYGSDPHREFAQRRSYNMVKRDVHRSLPRALPVALVGGVLLVLAARLRRRAAA
jgi:hypothetical protein